MDELLRLLSKALMTGQPLPLEWSVILGGDGLRAVHLPTAEVYAVEIRPATDDEAREARLLLVFTSDPANEA